MGEAEGWLRRSGNNFAVFANTSNTTHPSSSMESTTPAAPKRQLSVSAEEGHEHEAKKRQRTGEGEEGGSSSVISAATNYSNGTMVVAPSRSRLSHNITHIRTNLLTRLSDGGNERPRRGKVHEKLKSHLGETIERLKELSETEEASVEVGMEVSDLVAFLNIINSSDADLDLDLAGEKAGEGAMLLQQGFKLIEEAKLHLRSAITKFSQSNIVD